MSDNIRYGQQPRDLLFELEPDQATATHAARTAAEHIRRELAAEAARAGPRQRLVLSVTYEIERRDKQPWE